MILVLVVVASLAVCVLALVALAVAEPVGAAVGALAFVAVYRFANRTKSPGST